MLQPSWNSLTEIEGHLSFVKGPVVWAAMLIAAVATIWYQRHTQRYEDRASELKQVAAAKDSADKATEATRRADKLDAQLAESQQQVAALLKLTSGIDTKVTSRADHLTIEARRTLIENLKFLPANSVGIVTADPTSESTEFATALQGILAEAGCLGGSGQAIGSNFGANTPGRVLVQAFGDENKLAAEKIVSFLRDAGISDVAFEPTRPVVRTASTAQIVVRPK